MPGLYGYSGCLFLSPRPPLATRLLAHKIQSPQEWEAIQALTVRRRGKWVPAIPKAHDSTREAKTEVFGVLLGSLEPKGVVPKWPRMGVWASP